MPSPALPAAGGRGRAGRRAAQGPGQRRSQARAAAPRLEAPDLIVRSCHRSFVFQPVPDRNIRAGAWQRSAVAGPAFGRPGPGRAWPPSGHIRAGACQLSSVAGPAFGRPGPGLPPGGLAPKWPISGSCVAVRFAAQMSEMGGAELSTRDKERIAATRPSGFTHAHLNVPPCDSSVVSRLLLSFQRDYNQLSTSSKQAGLEESFVPEIFADTDFAKVIIHIY